MRNQVGIDDLITAILVGTSLAGRRVLRLDQHPFVDGVTAAFNELALQAQRQGYEVTFWLRDGDDGLVQDAVLRAVRHQLCTLENYQFRRLHLQIDAAYASRYLARMPGGAHLWTPVWQAFLGAYDGATASA